MIGEDWISFDGESKCLSAIFCREMEEGSGVDVVITIHERWEHRQVGARNSVFRYTKKTRLTYFLKPVATWPIALLGTTRNYLTAKAKIHDRFR